MALYSDDDDGGVIRGTRETPPSHYLLKVESFSLFSENGPDKLESKEFEAGERQWKIVFFPNGHSEENDDHVSVYLSLANTDSAVDAIFRFFLFDQIRGNYLTVQGSIRRFDNVKYNWGFAKFVPRDAFTDPSSGYLVKDTCFIGVDVFVLQNSGVAKCIGECLSLSKMENISYKHRWTVTRFSMLGKECYSDEFVVGGYKWKVLLYPEGYRKSRGCSLSLSLYCVNSPNLSSAQEVKAQFTLRLVDQINQEHEQKKTTTWFGRSIYNRGWPSFINLEDLKDSKRGFIVGDCCIIEAEVTVLFETIQNTLMCRIPWSSGEYISIYLTYLWRKENLLAGKEMMAVFRFSALDRMQRKIFHYSRKQFLDASIQMAGERVRVSAFPVFGVGRFCQYHSWTEI